MRPRKTRKVIGFVVLFLLMSWISALPCFAIPSTVSYPFKGVVDLTNKTVDVTLSLDGSSSLQLISKRNSSKQDFLLRINHLQTPRFLISTDVEIAMQEALSMEGKEIRKGSWAMKYALFDQKPIKDLRGDFELDKNKVALINNAIGPFTLNGWVNIAYPYAFNLDLILNEMDLEMFMQWWLKNIKNHYEGFVTGKINLTGDTQNVFVKADLLAQEVSYNDSFFNQVKIVASGNYPNLMVNNCLVFLADGTTASLTGPFNLNDKANYKNQVLAMRRNVSFKDMDQDELKWTLKSLDSNDPSVKTQIKYMRRKGDHLINKDNEEHNFFGVEQKMEF